MFNGSKHFREMSSRVWQTVLANFEAIEAFQAPV